MTLDIANFFLDSFDGYDNRENQIKTELGGMGFKEANPQTFIKENKNINGWNNSEKKLVYTDVNVNYNNNEIKKLETLPKENRKFCILSGLEKKVRAWGVK